jgi:hypothetical protein
VNRGSGLARRKQNDHGDYAGAEKHQDKSSEKLGTYLGHQRELVRHSMLSPRALGSGFLDRQ